MAVLYAPGRYFACRQCGGLTYATQKVGAGDRASTKADKLRKRMDWEAGILNGDGGKPKGMHWTTYQRLKNQSGDVGCAATSAKRHSAGSAPGMTALVEVTDTHRAPKVRQCLPPSR